MNEVDCTRLDQILGMIRSQRMWYLRRGAVIVGDNNPVKMIDKWYEILLRQLLEITHYIRTSGRWAIYEAVLKLAAYAVAFLEDLGEPPEKCWWHDD